MKKPIILLSFGFILLFGCKQNPPTPIGLNPDIQNSETQIYVLNFDEESPVWESVELTELQSTPVNNAASKNGNSAHAHGDFTGSEGSLSISFQGTQNNGGPHGSAEVLLTTPSGKMLHILMQTSCVAVIGNEAIYGGEITEVKVNTLSSPPPPPPGFPVPSCDPYDLGTYAYFRVTDNGQGANAPKDRYIPLIATSCSLSGDCLANSFPWFFFSSFEVEQPTDNIKVN